MIIQKKCSNNFMQQKCNFKRTSTDKAQIYENICFNRTVWAVIL